MQECRICGCTDKRACHHPDYGNCWWVEKDLCSHCAMIATKEIRTEDVSHLCNDTNCPYHACMSDECHYDQMYENGSNGVERFCEWIANNN